MTRAGSTCHGKPFHFHCWRRAGTELHWPTEQPPEDVVTPMSHWNPGTPQGAKQLSSPKVHPKHSPPLRLCSAQDVFHLSWHYS